MKKYYTVFKINNETRLLQDCGWGRYENEQDAINEVLTFDYNDELVVLPIYVPSKLQND